MKNKLITTLIAATAAVGFATAHAEEAKDVEYPIDTCPVSEAKLDSMGGPYIHQHEVEKDGETKTVEVRFCCEGCLAAFKKDPEKHLKKIYGE